MADFLVDVRKFLSWLCSKNVVVAISKGTQAVKHCTNKTLQFLTGGASYLYNGRKMVTGCCCVQKSNITLFLYQCDETCYQTPTMLPSSI